MLFLAKFCRMIYCAFHFLSTFYSVLLGHLANNFNFMLRSEFQKVMYCCTLNESTNNLQGNAICKSLLNIIVTQPGCQLPYSSAVFLRRPGDFWKIPISAWASHEASEGKEVDRESEIISLPICGNWNIFISLLAHSLKTEWLGSSHYTSLAGET